MSQNGHFIYCPNLAVSEFFSSICFQFLQAFLEYQILRGRQMSTVRQVLAAKSTGKVWSVSPRDSVFEAIALMSREGIGALVVVEDGCLVGIFSERDYARKVILKNRSSKLTLVESIMTEDVIFVGPKNTIEECLAIMSNSRIRHLPVLEEGVLKGLVSMGDIVQAMISHQEFLIHQLTRYVTDSAIPLHSPAQSVAPIRAVSNG